MGFENHIATVKYLKLVLVTDNFRLITGIGEMIRNRRFISYIEDKRNVVKRTCYVNVKCIVSLKKIILFYLPHAEKYLKKLKPLLICTQMELILIDFTETRKSYL